MLSLKTLYAGLAPLMVLGFVAVTVPAHAANTCADEIKVVKQEVDTAAPGPKKDEAMKHYQEADKAMQNKDEKGCLKHLKMARSALK